MNAAKSAFAMAWSTSMSAPRNAAHVVSAAQLLISVMHGMSQVSACSAAISAKSASEHLPG
jgi:hypothetical protein